MQIYPKQQWNRIMHNAFIQSANHTNTFWLLRLTNTFALYSGYNLRIRRNWYTNKITGLHWQQCLSSTVMRASISTSMPKLFRITQLEFPYNIIILLVLYKHIPPYEHNTTNYII